MLRLYGAFCRATNRIGRLTAYNHGQDGVGCLATLWQFVLSVEYGEPDNCQHIAHAGIGDVSP